jgi:GH24 family phage-related lysozyme (muramidase)
VQLPRWNKAHVNGVLVELPGMTARRAEEVRLFNST